MPTKIALISDSHSNIDHKTLSYLEDVDEIWHAGDIGSFEVMDSLPKGKPVRAVFGNIDDKALQETYPEWQEFTLDGVKILMTHHICKVEFDRTVNCLYMNPGAIGQHGFHVMRTMLLFDLEVGQIKNLRVVELGKRGKVL